VSIVRAAALSRDIAQSSPPGAAAAGSSLGAAEYRRYMVPWRAIPLSMCGIPAPQSADAEKLYRCGINALADVWRCAKKNAVFIIHMLQAQRLGDSMSLPAPSQQTLARCVISGGDVNSLELEKVVLRSP